MPADFRITGTAELEVISRHLKQTGNKELRKELLAGINRATKPLKTAVRASAIEKMPRRGGLNLLIAAAKLSTANRTSGRNIGVRISGKLAGIDLRSLDRGRLRHPVFGNKRVWVNQEVEPGWFSTPLEDGADVVRRELMDVFENVARRILDGR